ncbi:alpha/beta fold hydrolase [Nitrospirillum sp. BR 11164]|uniref:alpha/beta fold hydrolase n=1 Tax=Nitrospirillum sp. BR 11164 TaxID=3104324 RepID=UPI002AFFE8D3|nr:alpha/beta fold hydrolase [Nitrospirillum sp. BR 11164]MEA1652335.1 alpha/beta fold hydrolase [Nitrospirillum sp. BR 11164]
MTPIVLIPGLLCTAEVFAPQVAALWPHGPVTVANTLAGETMADMAAAILADTPPRFALGGLSMGGYVALEIMRQAPERVVKLALVSTQALPDTPEQSDQRRAFVALARKARFASVLRQAMAGMLHPDHRDDDQLAAVNLRMGLTVGVEGLARQTAAIISRPDSRPTLPAIRVPTLVLVGDSDPLMPPERSRDMAAAIPGARLVVVPQCGHASTLEQPEAVNQALVEWIRE